MASAWEMGLDGSVIPSMTPTEARGFFEVARYRNRCAAADMDRLAWLIGSYTGCGVNAPKKYPKKPKNAERIMENEKQSAMTDDEMRDVALRFARRLNHGGQCDRGAGNPV